MSELSAAIEAAWEKREQLSVTSKGAERDAVEAALDALAQKSDPACIQRLALNLDDDKYPVRYRTAATIIRLGSIDRRKQPTE